VCLLLNLGWCPSSLPKRKKQIKHTSLFIAYCCTKTLTKTKKVLKYQVIYSLTNYTRQNLSRVLHSRSGFLYSMHLFCFEAKLPSLKLKTWLCILQVFFSCVPQLIQSLPSLNNDTHHTDTQRHDIRHNNTQH
jgi:hypothetical protein